MRRRPLRTHADTVAHRRRRPASLRLHRPVARGEDQALTLADDGRGGARLCARSLLDDDELAAGVIRPRSVEADHHLDREHQLAVQIAVQRVPVARSVAQQQRRRTGLARGVALRRATRRARRARAAGGRVAPPSPVRSGAGAARTRRASRRPRRAAERRSTGTAPRRSGTAPCRSWRGSGRRRRRGRRPRDTRPRSTTARSTHSRGCSSSLDERRPVEARRPRRPPWLTPPPAPASARFASVPPRYPPMRAVAAHHPVTRHHERDRVLRAGRARRPHRGRVARGRGDGGVALGRAVRDVAEVLEDGAAEAVRELQVDRDLERAASTGEVLVELRRDVVEPARAHAGSAG